MKSKNSIIHNHFKNLLQMDGGNYELRNEQIEMSLQVHKSLENSEFLIVEAGTGVGKSLAYLLPAALYSLKTGQVVVISTETKALQSQLIEKDIPLLNSLLSEPIRAEIAFGASNYLCKRKFDFTIASGNFGTEMFPHLKEFYAWEKQTETGLRKEYRGFLTNEFWSKISRESESCLGKKCPNFSHSYYFLEKEKWKNANILIVNHYLLASHIASDLKILPEFKNLIIDEAHNFPDIIGKSFKIILSYQELTSLISFINGNDKKNSGLLGKIDQSLKSKKLINTIEKMNDNIQIYFGKLFERFPLSFQARRIKEVINPDNGNLLESLSSLVRELELIKKKIDPESEDLLQKEIAMELEFSISKCTTYINFLELISKPERENIVIWIEPPPQDSQENKYYSIHAQPLESNQILLEKLYPQMDSIVFTSATLSGNKNDFSFIKDRLGNPPISEKTFLSPFPYKKNSIIYLPKNIRDPVTNPEQFQEDLCKIIPNLIELSEGNTFILFTSNKMLQDVYNILLEKVNYPIFSQLELGADLAKDSYLQTANSVLMGVSSFWQGIDIKGDKLKSVIITKIPFQPPGEPVLEAKIEYLKNNNENPFNSIQLPHATITLKQGFGRLIRSATDKGFVALLDPRIQTKSYGKTLVSSLPPARIVNSFRTKEVYLNL